MFLKNKNVYFIGIGGIGMSGLAEILINLGCNISGSDLQKTQITERLESLGADIYYNHSASNINKSSSSKKYPQMIVISSAITNDNPELIYAGKQNIPIITRGELLADIMRTKKHAVAVAGAHGKTSTSSLIYNILEESDIESTAIIGGVLIKKGTNAYWGKGDYLVAETDEHDGSFLKLSPTVSVVTNIDEEHMEYYPSLEHLKNAFLDFIHKIPFYGFSVLCIDDNNICDILPKINCNKILYGLSDDADITASNIQFSNNPLEPYVIFDIINKNPKLTKTGNLGQLKVKTLGHHNVLNILAAVSTAIGLGLDFEIISRGLANFSGIKRRFEIKKNDNDFILIEDYAHHPNEIKAVINAVENIKKNRLIIVFQPHLFSRTKYFEKEFAQELMRADILYLLDIYPAREKPIPNVHSKNLLEIINKNCEQKSEKQFYYMENMDKAYKKIQHELKENDLVLVLGAGDVYRLADKLEL